MSDNRLNQIQDVLTELVRIVGNTNAAIEELRADVAVLKADVTELKADVAELKADVAELKAGQKKLEQRQDELKEELTEFKEETFRRFSSLDIGIEYLANKLVKHDMQLYEYKKLSKYKILIES